MIHDSVTKLFLKGINHIPRASLSRTIFGNSFVFEYHLVSDEELPHIQSLYPYKSQRAFADDLDYLEREFELPGYKDFIEREKGVREKSKPAVLITFDDGLAECYHVVRPMLLERGIPAVFFVTTDFIDNRTLFHRHAESLCIERFKALMPDQQKEYLIRLNSEFGSNLSRAAQVPNFLRAFHKRDSGRCLDAAASLLGIDFKQYLADHSPYLNREQIVQMAEEGFTIGAHSLNHPNFKGLDDESLKNQIIGSCEAVVKITGRSPVPFAFPYDLTGLNRKFLAETACKHEGTIGAMFGVHLILLDPPYVNRINADSPVGALEDYSNIPMKILGAYPRYLLRQLHRLLS